MLNQSIFVHGIFVSTIPKVFSDETCFAGFQHCVYIRKRLHFICGILGFLVQRYTQGEKELYSKENGFVGFLHGVHWKACTYARGSTSPLQSWQQHPQNTLVLGSLVDVLLLAQVISLVLIFIGPMCTWGPIIGSLCHSLLTRPF